MGKGFLNKLIKNKNLFGAFCRFIYLIESRKAGTLLSQVSHK